MLPCKRETELLQQESPYFDTAVKLAVSVESVSCIGSSSKVVTSKTEKGVSVSVRTELSEHQFLSKCCSTQTDSVSSDKTEQSHNKDTQTDAVSVLVSQHVQTEAGLYPGQLAQKSSLKIEKNCLEERSYENAPRVDRQKTMQQSSRACDSKECRERDVAHLSVNNKSALCKGRKAKAGEKGASPNERQEKGAPPNQVFCKDSQMVSCRKSPVYPRKGRRSPKHQDKSPNGTENWRNATEQSEDENGGEESDSVKKLSGDKKGGRKGDSLDKDTPCLPPVQPILPPSGPQNENRKSETPQKMREKLEVSLAIVPEDTSPANEESLSSRNVSAPRSPTPCLAGKM